MRLNRENIIAFWHEESDNGFYSQWHLCPIKIDGKDFICNEQYMMHSKAILFNDQKVAELILKSSSPEEIKKLGRQVKNFDSTIWDKNKEEIVYRANFAKFSQHEDLKHKLLASKDKIIIEASPYDRIWGVGIFANSQDILDTDLWHGQNLLGKAIMKVREELKKMEK